MYRALADGILLLHLCFILFVMLGGLGVHRWPRLVWLHVPAAVWGVLIEFGGWICPLTPLEITLRQRAGQAGYTGGFIEHYVTTVVYPHGLTRGMQWALGALALAVNVAIYFRLVARQRRGNP